MQLDTIMHVIGVTRMPVEHMSVWLHCVVHTGPRYSDIIAQQL